MSEPLKERHPLLMVPHVFTFGVVLYTNGGAPTWPAEAIRDALIKVLPPGTGVGEVSCTSHGVYQAPQGAISVTEFGRKGGRS